jgi:sarcosine oxidase subunit alpha
MTERAVRLPPGWGRVNREVPLRFSFDGRALTGYAGDSVASALLAHDMHLVGRSFKLHRPRGILSAGVEEPGALVTLRGRGRREPNIQAPMAELFEGLIARSQNRWPSLAFDAMAINNLFARFMPAGFYYKTFMGPGAKGWRFYEPAIRRAAGLGRAAALSDPDRYERAHAFCEVLVIGAGPAGLTAAAAAARAGGRVIVLEQQPVAGGQLLSEPAGSAADAWRRARLDELVRLGNVTLMTRTTAFGVYDGNVVGAVERAWDHVPSPPAGAPRQRTWRIHARWVIHAAGATERPLLFGDNDRPGVMLAEAARRYVNHFGVRPGGRVIVATNNDSAYAAAHDLHAAGAHVSVVDSRAEPPAAAVEAATADGIDVRTGCRIAWTTGGHRVRGVRVVGPREAADVACDLVCVSGGWSPNVHLTSHLGHKPAWHEALGAFVPNELPPGHGCAGAIAGALGLDEVVAGGWQAGADAGGSDAGEPPEAPAIAALPGHVDDAGPTDPPHPRRGKVFVDLQNDVSVDDIELAWREGYRSVEHLKRYTTLGMGTDQGRTSNINGLRIMAALRGQDVPGTGTTTFRPPFAPVALGALAGRRLGSHFRPQRRSPMHERHAAAGARFTPAGPWLRPWYYPDHGEDVDAAYVHEMQAVRGNVGMTDVSTLGKIDVQGPDAPELLSRVYVNAWRKLPVGKARYGVMLRDDGFALDDGTTTHVADDHYFMTTTTGQAARVMSWLEYLLETAWTDLRVHVTSVTDQWAGLAIAGPNSQRVLRDALTGVDLEDATLPPMGACEARTDDGLPLRILRVSFSGERAYEVYTPSGHGPALWDRVAAAGEAYGIVAYGLEALGALRIEKGHPVAAEIDGRTTLDDLGLGGLARTDKPFVGDVLRQRPAMQAADRRRLVGLRAEETGARLRVGALLYEADQPVEGHGIGHVTSVTWSPELDCSIGLAFVERGLEREGAVISAASPIHDERIAVRVVSPVFLDPDNERLHA